MIVKIRYSLILILLCFLFPWSLVANENTTRVLYIGNSYTYYHSMPYLVKAMAEHQFPDHQVETKFVGHGGATLKQHWEEGKAYHEIQTGEWDYVVLQEQSMLGEAIFEDGKSYVRSPDQFFQFARKFERAVRESGAKAVFYMTWSRRKDPDQQKYLNYAYMAIAKETESLIAPLGIVWDSFRTIPQFDLYEIDGSHPSVYGSYTAALMIFSILFDTVPIGIPGRLEGYEIQRGGKISETKRLLCDLPIRNTEIIQRTVGGVFEQMKANGGYLEVEKAVSDKKPSLLSKVLGYLSDVKGQFVLFAIIIGTVIFVKVCVFLLRR